MTAVISVNNQDSFINMRLFCERMKKIISRTFNQREHRSLSAILSEGVLCCKVAAMHLELDILSRWKKLWVKQSVVKLVRNLCFIFQHDNHPKLLVKNHLWPRWMKKKVQNWIQLKYVGWLYGTRPLNVEELEICQGKGLNSLKHVVPQKWYIING